MKILISGLSKTGTTGLLYLVKNSVGGEPTVLFEPNTCPPAVAEDGGTVLAKVLIGRELDAASFAHFDKKIVILRDVRDRLVSALLYSQYDAKYLNDDARVAEVTDCLMRKEREPRSVSVREILDVMGNASGHARAAEQHHRRLSATLLIFDEFMERMPDAFRYRYEDFVDRKYHALEEFLGFPIHGDAVVPERLKRVERTKTHGNWRDWLTEEDVATLRPLLSPYLARHGYDADDWELNPHPKIAPDHCSSYYSRLVEEKRQRLREQELARAQAAERAQTARRDAAWAKRGRIARVEARHVSGWAAGADLTVPVSVTLSVNGHDVAEVIADRLRPGLLERGEHPTGLCGFVFTLPEESPLREGDEVRVRRTSKAAEAIAAAAEDTVATAVDERESPAEGATVAAPGAPSERDPANGASTEDDELANSPWSFAGPPAAEAR